MKQRFCGFYNGAWMMEDKVKELIARGQPQMHSIIIRRAVVLSDLTSTKLCWINIRIVSLILYLHFRHSKPTVVVVILW